MITYQPYVDFTAHGTSVRALMLLYAQLEQRELSKPELLPFVVFMAFSIEAYLNSIGARHISFWDELERLPWRQKVAILHRHRGVTPNWGKDPLQFAVDVFRIRDKLAHGKSERVVGPKCDDPGIAGKGIDSLEPEWYSRIDRDWVRKAKDRFQALMTYLGSLYDLHESDHLHTSSGGLLKDDGVAA